jgi:hypothetical protein
MHHLLIMQIIKNNKGGAKLHFWGYMYTKKAVNKSTIRWGCYQRRGMSCKGSLITDTQIQRAVHSVSLSHDSNQDLLPLRL